MSEEGVPEGRCGFVLEPEDADKFYAEIEEAGFERWYEFSGAACCWRKVWDKEETDRCVWHAEVDEKPIQDLSETRGEEVERLDGVYLRGTEIKNAISFEGCRMWASNLRNTNLWTTDLSDADLWGADLEGANLRYSNLSNAILPEANLKGVDLEAANVRAADLTDVDLSETNAQYASFLGANLADADLTDTNLRQANLKAATLEDAVLTRTDLRGADLEYAELYQTLFSDVRMNNRTEFGETCQYEAHDVGPQIDDENDPDVTPLEAAAWTYRRIQTLHEENALAQDAREYHVKKAEAYRKLRWREFAGVWSRPHRQPKEWSLTLVRALTYSVNGRVSRHGESPHRVVGVSLLVILASTLLYPIAGIRSTEFASPRKLVYFPSLLANAPNPITDPVAVLGKSLYFSVVTFTTVGYGDLQPVGWSQLLATVESFTGALLMALLVFVLGRRATW